MLDGPDDLAYYWHDIRNEPRIRPSRVQGGGSLMIWGAFMGQNKCELAFVNGRMNALKYQGMLEDYLFPFIRRLNNDEVIFQQNNAPIHVAKSTKQWFNDYGIETLKWPALSSELNHIENLWGILARKVHDPERECRLTEGKDSYSMGLNSLNGSR